MDQITELEFEVKALREQLKKANEEIYKLQEIIKSNDLDGVEVKISDEEFICVNELRRLKELSEMNQFGRNEAQILDTIYKNLRLIRGMSDDRGKKKEKAMSKDELFKIVEGVGDVK